MLKDSLCEVRGKIFKAFAMQSSIALVLAVAFLLLQGRVAFFSVILGAVAWLLPSIYFIRKLFIIRQNQGMTAQKLLSNFYIGEVIKLILSGILIVIFLRFIPVLVLSFFSGYIIAVLSFWVLPIFLLKK